jgi:hypothetical protein
LTALRRTRLTWFVLGAIVLGIASWSPRARGAGDPYLEWWTIETPHFRVHYYRGLEPVAERVASIAESVNARLEVALGWKMSEVTEIVLTDYSDSANGSAGALPYNAIRLYVTAPDDVSPLGDYDDWYLELVTHEHTHVLHTDNITGIPAIANKIMGKFWSPNQAQPRWILEGLAVVEESEHTSGGRNRSSIFDMFLRADTLEHRLVPLDQMSHPVRRWPQGNIPYLYGSRFLAWIADVYGDDALREISRDYGRQIVPWGINRSVRRATGKTYEELYRGWSAFLEQHYDDQLQKAAARGWREGVRLTHHGETVASPRFVPAFSKRSDATYELLYFRDDGHSRSGMYRLPLDGSSARESDEQLVARTLGQGSGTIAPDGSMIWSSVAYLGTLYAFDDLFRLPPGADAPSGFEPERQRLTEGQRTLYPDVGPDGDIVFAENHHGTSTLVIGQLTDDGAIADSKALVPSARFEQAYTPRFSPDGKWVAYSTWTAGGYRDIRLVEVETGKFLQVTHDRAMDWDPCFSPDGRIVFFSSDRAFGIPNIFAFDREDGSLWQVTNVRTGALYPAISPDGQRLVYVGYTSYGYDLYSLPIDRKDWLPAEPYLDTRPDPPDTTADRVTSRHPYNPLPTLRPRSWSFEYGPGSFGDAISVSTSGSDVLGHHSFAASVLVETERGDPQGGISYAYGNLPFDFNMSLYRSLSPFHIGDDRPLFIQQNLGAASGVSYFLPSEFEAIGLSASYSITRFDGPVPNATKPDPYSLVRTNPPRGQLGAVHLGFSYSNPEQYLYSVTAENGFSFSASANIAVPALASDYTLYTFGFSIADYLRMPWGGHVLALHASSAIAAGDYPYRGIYYNGGFLESSILDALSQGSYQGPFVLRGYAPYQFSGSQYQLFNAEYRFPIVNVDHGISTLPAFLERINGNVFADWGGAFEVLDARDWVDRLHLGVGAELWLEMTFGYVRGANIRLGYATGLGDPKALSGGQTYVVVALPF